MELRQKLESIWADENILDTKTTLNALERLSIKDDNVWDKITEHVSRDGAAFCQSTPKFALM